jgi:hypothetical protein
MALKGVPAAQRREGPGPRDIPLLTPADRHITVAHAPRRYDGR